LARNPRGDRPPRQLDQAVARHIIQHRHSTSKVPIAAAT
jgi:hypothetical protein